MPAIKLPKKIDWTPQDVAGHGSGRGRYCVPFATASGMKEHQEFLDYGKLVVLSPRFIYGECKKIDGMPGSETTTIRAAMQVLKNEGLPYA